MLKNEYRQLERTRAIGGRDGGGIIGAMNPLSFPPPPPVLFFFSGVNCSVWFRELLRLLESVWQNYPIPRRRQQKLARELANPREGEPLKGEEEEEEEEDTMAGGLQEEEEEALKEEDEEEDEDPFAAGQEAVTPSDPEEKPKKMAKLANPYLGQASRSSHPVNLKARPTKKS